MFCRNNWNISSNPRSLFSTMFSDFSWKRFWTDFLFRDIPMEFPKTPLPFLWSKTLGPPFFPLLKGEPTRIVPVRLFDAHPAFKAARPLPRKLCFGGKIFPTFTSGMKISISFWRKNHSGFSEIAILGGGNSFSCFLEIFHPENWGR